MSSKWSEKLHVGPVDVADPHELQPNALGMPVDAFDFDWSDTSWFTDFTMMPDCYRMMSI